METILQMKHLEKKGDKEGAISIAEQKAWSSALQKAEGKKVSSISGYNWSVSPKVPILTKVFKVYECLWFSLIHLNYIDDFYA